jgi:hypothetical protein
MSIEEDSRREKIKEIHKFSSWTTKVKDKKRRDLSTDFSVSRKEFTDIEYFSNWELVRKEPVRTERAECKGTEYLWRDPTPEKEEELVQIRIFECNSSSNAHEAIIDFMMSASVPKFPNCEESGIDIGDVCFAGYGQIPTGIIFARDNVMVYIRSVGKNDISVKEIAEKIDSMIRGKIDIA